MDRCIYRYERNRRLSGILHRIPPMALYGHHSRHTSRLPACFSPSFRSPLGRLVRVINPKYHRAVLFLLLNPLIIKMSTDYILLTAVFQEIHYQRIEKSIKTTMYNFTNVKQTTPPIGISPPVNFPNVKFSSIFYPKNLVTSLQIANFAA